MLSKKQIMLAVAVAASSSSAFACDRYVVTRVYKTYYRPSVVVFERPSVPMVQQPMYVSADPDVAVGSTLGIAANFLGKEQGFVMLTTENTTHNLDVQAWSPTGVTVKLPEMGLSQPISARLDVVLPTGKIAKSARVRLIRQPELVVIGGPTTAASSIADNIQSNPGDAPTGGLTLTPAGNATLPVSN